MGRIAAHWRTLRARASNGRGAQLAQGRLWALDLETTGLDARNDRIIAVGMVAVDDGVIRAGTAYSSLVRPSLATLSDAADAPGTEAPTAGAQPLSPEAQASIEAHHLRPSDVASAPPITAVLPEVLARLEDSNGLIVHHAGLDVAMLRRACEALNTTWPSPTVIDTIRLIDRVRRRWHVAGVRVPYDLAGARMALGLPPHDAHDALSDAIAAAELYLALTSRL